MSDYISKSSVCEILADIYPTDGERVVLVKEIDKAYEEILQLPYVQPQRIGRWISVFDEDEDKCSECQATFFCASTRFNFCPNCGALMEDGS